ncbi:MAG: nicotinamide-nucleotide amidohydrolase family protein [Kiritimatiellae bacterium]|nr:nicotinamide-nucleotide amidohydrolase family protein [Kiritimatiellia bacterium]
MTAQAANLVELFKAYAKTCATAESCTGGMIGSLITAVPGSSEVYLGGVVSYANSVKEGVLGVSGATLENFGAVSEQCALEMAEGARRLTRADVAVSVTGIAGPGGGSAGKPVGLVWFAVATKDGVRAEKAIFAGSRDDVRKAAAMHAIGMMTIAAMA